MSRLTGGVNGYGYVRHGLTWVRCDETTWPRSSGETVDGISRRLRYGGATREDMMHAAEVLNSYGALIHKPLRTIAAIVRAVRRGDEDAT